MNLVQVKVIRSKGAATLVEWTNKDGCLERASIPSVEVKKDSVNIAMVGQDILDQGIDYGIPFSDVLPEYVVSPKTISNILHLHGIWTESDLRTNSNELQGVILECCKNILRDLSKLSKKK